MVPGPARLQQPISRSLLEVELYFDLIGRRKRIEMYIRVDDGQPLQVLQSCQRYTRATKSMFWMVCPTMLQACQQQYLVARMSDVTNMSRRYILDWNDFRLVCQRTLHACQTSVYTHLGLLNVLLTVFVSMLSVYSDCYCLQADNGIL